MTDDDGATACDTFQVTVNNAAPTVDVGADQSVDEGATVSLSPATFNDLGTADTHTATVNWGDGSSTKVGSVSETPFGPPGSTAGADGAVSGSHVYADNGSYLATVCVTDDDFAETCDSFTVTVNNVAPALTDSDPKTTAFEGIEVSLPSVQFSDPGFDSSSGPTSEDFTATVNWDDRTATESGTVTEIPGGAGAPTTGTVEGRHVYADNGTYSVEVCVTDDDGATTCAILTVTIFNMAPTVDAGVDQSTTEGAVVSLDPATFNDLGTLDTHTATIAWGDGTATEVGAVNETPYGPPGSTSGVDGAASGSHVYADDGAYIVTVCVTDDDTMTTCDTLTITVANVAPTVDAGSDQSSTEGAVVSLAPATFNDLGTADAHTATIAWGDGTATEAGAVSEVPFGPPGSTAGANGTVSGSHVYADGGAYTVTVCVTDDGATTCDTLTVTINNMAPSVEAGVDQSSTEGAIVSLDPATFNDLGTLDIHTATIAWGDGTVTEAGAVTETPFGPPGSTSGSNGTVSGSHTYVDNGTYTVTVTVTDDDGSSGSDSFTVVASNVNPDLTLDRTGSIPFSGGNAFIGRKGSEQTHSATALDPGFDNLTFNWSFAPDAYNGSESYLSSGVVVADSQSVTFSTPGIYTVAVTVTDDDLGSDSDFQTKIVVDDCDCAENKGFWKRQFKERSEKDARKVEKGQLIAEDALSIYLDIVRYASSHFDEAVPLSTMADANNVFNPPKPNKGGNGSGSGNGSKTRDATKPSATGSRKKRGGSDESNTLSQTGGNIAKKREQALEHTLTAWLNFARGAVDWDEAITVDKGTGKGAKATPAVILPFNEVIAQVEAILNNPDATHDDLVNAKKLADSISKHKGGGDTGSGIGSR